MRGGRTASWRTKLALLLLVFSAAPVIAVSFWGFDILVDTYETATLDSLQAIARAKAEAIDQYTDYRKRDVERIASLVAPDLKRVHEAERAVKSLEATDAEREPPPDLPELQDAEALEERKGAVKGDEAKGVEPDDSEVPDAPEQEPPSAAVKTPEVEALESAFSNLRRTLALILWDQKEFEELLVFDPTGRVVASTFEGHQGRTAKNLDYFESGRRATYIQPVFMSPITEQLTMVIATPMRDEELREIGVVAARLNLQRFFRLINDTTGLGKTGETIVAKKLVDEIAFMAPTRHEDLGALERRIGEDATHSGGLLDAVRGRSGTGIQLDYRGMNTYAAWQFVPSLEWGLAVKIDESEVREGVDTARQRTLILTLLVLLLVVPASFIAARALVRPLRALKEATDRISRGDFAVQLDIRSNDEIGELADSFERMVAAIKFFREHSMEDDEEVPPEDSEEADGGPVAR